MCDINKFNDTMAALEAGTLRVADKVGDTWHVHPEIKETILSGFRMGSITDMSCGVFSFYDKDTFPARTFSREDNVRIVPGGTTVRRGAYVAPSAIIMPPSYINVGAYVGDHTMIDSHALVGSCAQVGSHVHLSAASQLGGVLEPIGALPVIIEDHVFIGGNCGIYEGTLVREYAVIATGVTITASTAVYDAVNGCYLRPADNGRVEIPRGAVVVPGSRPIAKGPGADAGIHIYTPVIVKYRDEKTDASVVLEDLLR